MSEERANVSKPRIRWMDTVRGLAILAVLIMHAEIEASGATGQEMPLLHEVNAILGPIRMPLLMALSGMLLHKGLAKPWPRFIKGKWDSILWPYFVWSTINLLQLTVMALAGGGRVPGAADWARVLYDPPTYLWFLAYLFHYFLIARAVGRTGRIALIPLCFLVAPLIDVAVPHRFAALLGYFLLGNLVGRFLVTRSRMAPHQGLLTPIQYVGEHSLVFYASHLVLVSSFTHLFKALGVTTAYPLWGAAIAATLAVGVALQEGRKFATIDALFNADSLITRSRANAPGSRQLLPR